MPRRALLLLATLVATHLSAQDVTLGELQWLADPAPTDPLPKRGSRPRVSYPEEFRQGDVLGYVILTQRIKGGPGGAPVLMYAGTHPPFIRAVQGETRQPDVRELNYKTKPPPDAPVWQAFIFNPKSAGPKLRDATPRLLAVTPIILSTRLGGTASGTGWVKVSVDETGAVTNVDPEESMPANARDSVREAVKQWKFAPARHDGRPIAAEISVPVVAQANFTSSTAAVVQPRPLGPPGRTFYPPGLQASGLRGEVLLQFDVETDGRVTNPFVVRSSNPALEPFAQQRLRDTKFAPGTRDGVPERMSTKMGISFEPPDAREAARVHVPSAKNMAKLPEELRFDVAPRPRGVVVPVYPYALLRDKVRGHAQAALRLDERGRVVRAEIVEASHPEFGQALLAAVARFEFEPALRAGRPTATVVTHRHEFPPADQFPPFPELELLTRELKKPETIVAAEKLDAPLQPVSRAAPLGPGGEGSAVVEFLVDETGRARLPRIVESSALEFGYAAVQAAAAWQFAPPRAGGKAAVVRVRVPFNFSNGPAATP